MSANTSEEKTLVVARKQNRLVDGSYRLSLQALRVFAMAVHKLRPGQKTVTFEAAEFMELLQGREDTRNVYLDLRAVAKEIVKAPVSLPGEQRGDTVTTWTETTLAASAELRADGTFQLRFSDELMPYLEQLAGHYTFVELPVAMSLTSRHAFRLYEVARSWDNYRDKKTGKHRGVRFSLEDLYRLMGVEEGEYGLYGHFKNRVLNRACSEIEEKSELRFRRSKKDGFFDELKSGKKVVSVRFTLDSEPLLLPAPGSPAPVVSASSTPAKAKAEKPKKPPAASKPKPAPSVDPAPELPFAVVMPTVALAESRRTKEPVEVAHARLTAEATAAAAETQARARVQARLLALEAAEKAATTDPEVLRICNAEYLQAKNELHELVARDQEPPEPEDFPGDDQDELSS